MAYQSPGRTLTYKAGADLSTKQYHFVFFSGVDTVDVCTTGTQRAAGIVQNSASINEGAEVMLWGVSKVKSDVALTVNDHVAPSSDGQAATVTLGTSTTVFVRGQVLQGCTSAGSLATVMLIGPHRGA